VPLVAPSAVVRPRPDAAEIFGRLKPNLTACYERGRKAVPTMLDGKLTMNASIDVAGTTTCAIPTDDTGLTQEVEDCMSARFAAERFGEGSATTVAVPIVARRGNVELGTTENGANVIQSVETHRMPDAFDVLESLVPELQVCVRSIDRSSAVRSVVVGARVGGDGRTQCALASGAPVTLPAALADCTAKVFQRARFPPPSGGSGLILVPITLERSN
jgi:hypothetical protein